MGLALPRGSDGRRTEAGSDGHRQISTWVASCSLLGGGCRPGSVEAEEAPKNANAHKTSHAVARYRRWRPVLKVGDNSFLHRVFTQQFHYSRSSLGVSSAREAIQGVGCPARNRETNGKGGANAGVVSAGKRIAPRSIRCGDALPLPRLVDVRVLALALLDDGDLPPHLLRGDFNGAPVVRAVKHVVEAADRGGEGTAAGIGRVQLPLCHVNCSRR